MDGTAPPTPKKKNPAEYTQGDLILFNLSNSHNVIVGVKSIANVLTVKTCQQQEREGISKQGRAQDYGRVNQVSAVVKARCQRFC